MRQTGSILRIIIDAALIALGSYLFFGYVDITLSKWYTPILIVLVGLVLLPKSNDPTANYGPSLVLIVIGLGLIARYYSDNQPGWLRYGLGAFLALSGAVDLIRQIRHWGNKPATAKTAGPKT